MTFEKLNTVTLSDDHLHTLLSAAREHIAVLSEMIRICDDISDQMDLDAEREVLKAAIVACHDTRKTVEID